MLSITAAARVAALAVDAHLRDDAPALARAMSPIMESAEAADDTYRVACALAAGFVKAALPEGVAFGVSDRNAAELPPALVHAGHLVSAVGNRNPKAAAAVWANAVASGGGYVGDVLFQLVNMLAASLQVADEESARLAEDARRRAILDRFRDTAEAPEAHAGKVRAEREWFA